MNESMGINRAEACRIYLRGELAKDTEQDRVNALVAGLIDDAAILVTRALSSCRNNGVWRDLERAHSFELVSVPTAYIRLRQAEPVLGERFEANEWRLTRIASDKQVLASKPYIDRSPDDRVEYPVLLAIAEGVEYRVIDGIHRAIQLARNGKEALTLCVVR